LLILITVILNPKIELKSCTTQAKSKCRFKVAPSHPGNGDTFLARTQLLSGEFSMPSSERAIEERQNFVSTGVRAKGGDEMSTEGLKS